MDTKLLRDQADIIDKFRKQREEVVISRNKVLAVKCGQETTTMNIGGVIFNITQTNNYYMPEVVQGMEVIQSECAKILQARIETLDSKIMGAENELRRLTKFNMVE